MTPTSPFFRKIALILSLLSLPVLLLSCENDKSNPFESLLFGTAISNAGMYLYSLNGTINGDLNQTCGSVSPVSTSTTTSTTTTTTPSTYKIESYYYIDIAKNPMTFNYPLMTATLVLRYKYDKQQTKFSLNPLNTTFTTCNTKDNINCDTTGTLVCETVDNIKCGGADTFIFTQPAQTVTIGGQTYNYPAISFQAYTGTIDWQKGFTLNSAKTLVKYSKLKFNMVAKDGTGFQGSITCIDNFN